MDSFHATNTWEPPDHFKTDQDGIPLFMGKAIRLAIDGNSVAVDCVRQLSYIFYKLEVPYDPELENQFLDQFINTDRDLGSLDFAATVSLPRETTSMVRETFTVSNIIAEMKGLISRILSNFDPLDIRPCHGSGATACHTPNHEKWAKLRYFPKLDQVYDYPTYFFFSASHLADELDKLERSELKDPRARVCLVPKDSRGPRIISCEPAELMYIQQGLMRLLYGILETHHLTAGYVNFTDQTINQMLARLGSLTDQFATLDLKDASDRVSLSLVRQVFPENWVECLEASRSEVTVLPDGREVKLNKFAPMGSSCCFPVEALVFWACAQATLRLSGAHPTRDVYFSTEVNQLRMKTSRGKMLLPEVFVYGDDIICHSDHAATVIRGLEAVGLFVNRSKSYVRGKFRESCGGDYHFGYDVTPVRLRAFLENIGTGLEASADFANELIAKFGYEDSHSAIRVIEESVGYFYPRTLLDIPMTIRSSPSASNDAHFQRRWNSNLQRYEYRILQLRHEVKRWRQPDWSELLRKELSREKAQARYPYENQLAIIDSSAEPGWYAVAHSARKKWAWSWLG
jgi:hypothetical protein